MTQIFERIWNIWYKAKQIMLRRDMYYFQKGNELENLRTFQPIYAGH